MKGKNIVFAGLILYAGLAVGGDSKPLKTRLVMGLTMTDGNSETVQGNLALLTEGRKEGLGSIRAGAEANYGESTVEAKSEKTVENAKIFGNVRRTLCPRTFAYFGAGAGYDDIADIEYRVTVSPGYGVYLLQGEKLELSVELGPAYIWEKVGNVREDYLALRVAQRLDYAMSEIANLWQALEYLPESEDFKDEYFLNGELGVEAQLNSRVKLRTVLKSEYNNAPAEGKERNDLTLISALSIAL